MLNLKYVYQTSNNTNVYIRRGLKKKKTYITIPWLECPYHKFLKRCVKDVVHLFFPIQNFLKRKSLQPKSVELC